MSGIDVFISNLSKKKLTSHARNLYQGRSKSSKIRKNNLKLYLQQMQSLQPNILLVGEAPGYKGCGITGVPFTSERILFQHTFFKNKGYQNFHSEMNFESEMSATIVWDEISRWEKLPLIWNIFPFHPHKLNQMDSNRTPNREELLLGKEILLEVLQLFPITKIIAIGRKAESQLQDVEYPFVYVRHPSHGGKHQFIEGIREI